MPNVLERFWKNHSLAWKPSHQRVASSVGRLAVGPVLRQIISSEVFCLSVLVCRAFVHQSAATMYLPADIGEPLFRV